MAGTHVLALDLGSSSVKVVVFAGGGEVVEEHEAEYPTSERAGGIVEQDPEQWWSASCRAMRQVSATCRIGGVSLTGTMQNLIALGAGGEVLRPALLYSDARAHAEFEQLAGDLEALDATALLGNGPNPQMPVTKLAWMRRHEPELLARIHHLHFGAKDYLAFRLTGRHVTDPTCASTVGLLDIRAREWAAPLLRRFAGVDPSRLPEVRPATEIVGPVTVDAAGATGLEPGIPVVNGCGDVGAATLGVASAQGDDTYIYLGTSGWVARSVPAGTPKHTGELYQLAHPRGGLAIHVSPFLTGGSGVRWFSALLGRERSMPDLDRLALAEDAGPPEVMFLPYLYGERGPFNDPLVRAGFLGLAPNVTEGALYYAVLEGVAFAIRNNVLALGDVGPELGFVGGGGLSPVWPQLVADALGRTLRLADLPAAATAAGAYALALEALGIGAYAPRGTRLTAPRAERRARMDRRWRQFLMATDAARAFASPQRP